MNGCVSFHLQNCCEIIVFQNLLGWYLEIGSLEMTLVETVRSENAALGRLGDAWQIKQIKSKTEYPIMIPK